MQQLDELTLKSNGLTRLDPPLLVLTGLEVLHLSHNAIARIAPPMAYMTRLDEVSASCAPIAVNCLSQAAVSCTWRQIR